MGKGSAAIPLTEFQSSIARLLAGNRTPDSHLAGGAALHIEPSSSRYSNALDYFQDSEERVASAFAEDRATLEQSGYAVQVLMTQPGYVRALALAETGAGNGRTAESTKIEWAHDSAWRFLPPVKSEVAGFVLHPIDLAVNKLLAVLGRDEPRDFLDLLDANDEILPIGALAWAAAGKDPGFTPSSILTLLRRRGKYRPEDFARLRLRQPVVLADLKGRWLEALEEAEQFIASRPAEELGCLYYSPQDGFVGDLVAHSDVVPHFGRPGGVIPRLSE